MNTDSNRLRPNAARGLALAQVLHVSPQAPGRRLVGTGFERAGARLQRALSRR
eukprot:CAMPEP_0197938992 /NCGR_PEP_ID=MMETSP1439-20131203/119017_1 /TAXON_ID=66791 /ORGANISM="Gonyaulax spinifera, Strain CCMP409" /LENGTH=52 /DNA_ID=CAMNT_0043562085 /DNA_START=45 /DNA_END=201 /DNA_ORIENTATION=-